MAELPEIVQTSKKWSFFCLDGQGKYRAAKVPPGLVRRPLLLRTIVAEARDGGHGHQTNGEAEKHPDVHLSFFFFSTELLSQERQRCKSGAACQAEPLKPPPPPGLRSHRCPPNSWLGHVFQGNISVTDTEVYDSDILGKNVLVYFFA